MASNSKSETFLQRYGYDLLLASIAALYVLTIPYTKVEESFNVQVSLSLFIFFFLNLFAYFYLFIIYLCFLKAMHDILYHWTNLENVSLLCAVVNFINFIN